MARDLRRPLREAWIVDAVRTPIGRYGGALAAVRPDDLAAVAIGAIVERTGIDPSLIEDVVLGCANGAGEDNRNVARMAALLAGLPVEVAGQTVNRLCGSGLQAVNSAAHAIGAGDGDVFVAGGVESMTRAPYVVLKAEGAWDRGARTMEDTTLGWRFVNPRMREAYPPITLGETAECVAEQWTVSRERQDAFALESQRRAVAAIESGRFDGQLVPVTVAGRKGADDGRRSRRAPASRHVGRGAGRAQARVQDERDGDGRQQLGDQRRRRRAAAGRGGARAIARPAADGEGRRDRRRRRPPRRDGHWPRPGRAQGAGPGGHRAADLDVIEINEAFASQAVACMDELGLDPARVNPNGGAIALGHPLGATGARLVTMVVHELARTGGRYGLATMCIGVGQGIATIVERSRPDRGSERRRTIGVLDENRCRAYDRSVTEPFRARDAATRGVFTR